MATFYMLLASAAQVSVALLARAAGRYRVDAAVLLAIAVLLAGLATVGGTLSLVPFDTLRASFHVHQLAMPLTTASLGCVGTLLYFEALQIGPTGPIATIVGLQVLVPVLLAAAIWHDRLGSVQIGGAILAGVAMCMVNTGDHRRKDSAPAAGGGQRRDAWKFLAILAALLQGLANSVFKYKEVHFPEMPTSLFLAVHFMLCAVFVGAYLLVRRRVPTVAAWGLAALMGLAMIAANGGMILALKGLSATVVYLTVLAGSVVLVVLISMAVLGERYPRHVQGAIVAGLLGIVLLVCGA